MWRRSRKLPSSLPSTLKALHTLSLPVQAINKAGEDIDRKQPICFEYPSDYEITVNGKKLIGSAQARKKEGVLQHGSLPLSGDLTRITQVLRFTSEKKRAQAASRLLEKATNVESVLNLPVSWDQAAQAFAQAFQEVLNIDFIKEDLTPTEKQRARDLIEETYGQAGWTEKS